MFGDKRRRRLQRIGESSAGADQLGRRL